MAIGVAAAVTVTSALQDASQHKVLFEKATFTMETKGDLQGAIALFEEIVRKYPNERDYAAQALLQIGLCYEKLGVEGARGAYQRLIKEYPGQTAAVAAARERLDNLLRAASPAKKGEGDVTIRKVLTPKGWLTVTGAVSPDGKYLADLAEVGREPRRAPRHRDPHGQRALPHDQGRMLAGAPGGRLTRRSWSAMDKPGLSLIPLDGSAPGFWWT